MKTDTVFFENKNDWRKWLKKNHKQQKEIWLVYYKKHTGKPSVSYNDAVEEAICFGWIDSTVRRIDEERYMQRFTPRSKNSKWSVINKKRALKLIANKKMTKYGLALINIAKNNGAWENAYSSKEDKNKALPADLLAELSKNTLALNNFSKFSLSCKQRYIKWINDAKKPDTRKRRIARTIEYAANNVNPYL